MSIPLGAVPVSQILASKEWAERVDANPENYLKPELRVLLQIPRVISAAPVRGTATMMFGGKMVLLDARTEVEKLEDAEVKPHERL